MDDNENVQDYGDVVGDVGIRDIPMTRKSVKRYPLERAPSIYCTHIPYRKNSVLSNDLDRGRLSDQTDYDDHYKSMKSSEDTRSNCHLRQLNTQLLEAVENGEVKEIIRLKQLGASPNATCQLDQVSACHLAALKDDESLSTLLKFGAKGIRIDQFGRNPIHLAAWAGNTKQIAALLGFSQDLQNRVVNKISHETEIEIRGYNTPANLLNMPCGIGCDSTIPNGWRDSMVHNCRRTKEKLPVFQKGWTALHVASAHAHLSCVQLLITAGADIHVQDLAGSTPLDVVGHSYYSGFEIDVNKNTIKMLLNAGATVNKNNSIHLHIAVGLDNEQVIKELLDDGFPAICLDINGLTALHICVQKRHKEYLELLANCRYNNEQDSHKVIVDAKDSNGFTVLHAAVRDRWTHGVLIAMHAGASIFTKDNNGESPFHTAVAMGDINILQGLLTVAKSNIDLCNEDGETALFIAIKHNHLEVVKILMKNGASIRIVEPQRLNVLHVAAQYGRIEMMDYFFSYEGGNIESLVNDISQIDRYTPIVYAVMKNHPKCVNFLLKKDAKIDMLVPFKDFVFNETWTTVLHIAVIKNYFDIIKILLHYDNKIMNIRDSVGHLPIHKACIKVNKEIISLFIHNGADLVAKHSTVITPLDMLLQNLFKPAEFLESIFDSYISRKGLHDQEYEVTVNYRILLPHNYLNRKQMRVIKCLVQTGNAYNQRKLLQHPLIESFLYLEWEALLPFFYLILALYVWFLLSLNVYVISIFFYNDHYRTNIVKETAPSVYASKTFKTAPDYLKSDIWKYMIYVSGCVVALQEILFVKVRKSLLCLETWVKFGAVGLAMFLPSLIHYRRPDVMAEIHPEWVRLIATVTITLSWVEMMFMLSRFPSWGFYVLIFMRVTIKVLKILFAYGFLIIGFAFGFMIQFRAQSPFEGPWAAITKTFVMLTSEYDYTSMINNQSVHHIDASILTLRLMFVIFVILASVVLMNLMVGVAVNDVNNLETIGLQKRLEKQVEFLTLLEDIVCNNVIRNIIPRICNTGSTMGDLTRNYITIRPQDTKCQYNKILPTHIKEAIFEKACLQRKQQNNEIKSIVYKKKLNKILDDINRHDTILDKINKDIENISKILYKLRE